MLQPSVLLPDRPTRPSGSTAPSTGLKDTTSPKGAKVTSARTAPPFLYQTRFFPGNNSSNPLAKNSFRSTSKACRPAMVVLAPCLERVRLSLLKVGAFPALHVKGSEGS